MTLHRSALIGLFFVSILWGCNYAVSAYLLHSFSPIFLSSVRISITSLFLLLIALLQRSFERPTKNEWLLLVGAGIFGTLLNQTFYFTGLGNSTAANAALIIAMAPIATTLMERIFYKEPLTVSKISGAVISLIGVLTIVSLGTGTHAKASIWGDVNLVFAMLSLSASLLFIRRLTTTMSPYAVTILSTMIGSILMIPAVGVEEFIGKVVISSNMYVWVLLAAAGIICQGLAGFWWNKGVAVTGAGTAAMFMNIPPFIALIMAHLFLGDEILFGQILGGILVLAGVFVATRTVRPRAAHITKNSTH